MKRKTRKHLEIGIFLNTMCSSSDTVGCLLAWVSLQSVALGNLMSNHFVVVDDFKLDNKPLIDKSEINWSTIRCSLLCHTVETCESLSVKKDGTRCQLFSVSAFAMGSITVKDNEWQILSKPDEF